MTSLPQRVPRPICEGCCHLYLYPEPKVTIAECRNPPEPPSSPRRPLHSGIAKEAARGGFGERTDSCKCPRSPRSCCDGSPCLTHPVAGEGRPRWGCDWCRLPANCGELITEHPPEHTAHNVHLLSTRCWSSRMPHQRSPQPHDVGSQSRKKFASCGSPRTSEPYWHMQPLCVSPARPRCFPILVPDCGCRNRALDIW